MQRLELTAGTAGAMIVVGKVVVMTAVVTAAVPVVAMISVSLIFV